MTLRHLARALLHIACWHGRHGPIAAPRLNPETATLTGPCDWCGTHITRRTL